MEISDIKAKAQRQAAGGLDARTITVDMELTLGRVLNRDEAQAVVDGWRAAAPDRAARHRAAGQRAADEAAGRAPASPTVTAILCSRTGKRKRRR